MGTPRNISWHVYCSANTLREHGGRGVTKTVRANKGKAARGPIFCAVQGPLAATNRTCLEAAGARGAVRTHR